MNGRESDGRAEAIRQRLRNALRDRGEDVTLGLPRYAVERFLYRLGRSRQRELFVLKGATLFAIFVRTLRVMDLRPGQAPRVEDDADAQNALGETAVIAREAGVPFIPIYVTSPDIAEEILDHTVTYGCDTLIMGKSRRSLFSRKIEGDVVTSVAETLPDDVALITRSATTPHVGTPIELPTDEPPGPGPAGRAGPEQGRGDGPG